MRTYAILNGIIAQNHGRGREVPNLCPDDGMAEERVMMPLAFIALWTLTFSSISLHA